MKVYKFGGTSVKDADGVRNLKLVMQTIGYSDTVLVISAMGKMTNAFEKLVSAHLLDDEIGNEENNRLEDIFNNFGNLIQDLRLKYNILYNKNLSLYTIRHFTEESILEIEKGRKVLIKQLSRETAQIVVQN